MFSLPRLTCSPSVAPDSLRPLSSRPLLSLRSCILICGSSSRGRSMVRMRGSNQNNAVELTTVDRCGSSDVVEDSGSGDAAEILTRECAPPDLEYTLNRLILAANVTQTDEAESGASGAAWTDEDDQGGSKWLVASLFGFVILWKHDAEAMWAAMGAVVNAGLSTILKRILNQQRPSAFRSGPGMPSTHAQSIFYAAVFAVASFTRLAGINVFTVGVGVITFLCGSYLSWLRVSQRLHTVNQVLVGAALGSACSLTWFWLWHSFVLQAFILSIWVRIFVILGSSSFCVAFLLYVLWNWLQDE
ncbi:hypothetical protein KSP40_PGU013810 [Platanthera guangdongensis]|uniref:Phosphatidic acid phosphatase type 2/haloperoxidase domain-containing protein n=1 Tax=Platanthera guangdongensis TaxID=2320717 RepID=A0ABR2MH31_9ASPA